MGVLRGFYTSQPLSVILKNDISSPHHIYPNCYFWSKSNCLFSLKRLQGFGYWFALPGKLLEWEVYTLQCLNDRNAEAMALKSQMWWKTVEWPIPNNKAFSIHIFLLAGGRVPSKRLMCCEIIFCFWCLQKPPPLYFSHAWANFNSPSMAAILIIWLSHSKIISIKTCVGFPGPLKVKIGFQCFALKCSLILMEKLFSRKSIRSRRSRLEEIMVTSSRLSFGDLCKRDGGALI